MGLNAGGHDAPSPDVGLACLAVGRCGDAVTYSHRAAMAQGAHRNATGVSLVSETAHEVFSAFTRESNRRPEKPTSNAYQVVGMPLVCPPSSPPASHPISMVP